jgi:hypothetical protein
MMLALPPSSAGLTSALTKLSIPIVGEVSLSGIDQKKTINSIPNAPNTLVVSREVFDL